MNWRSRGVRWLAGALVVVAAVGGGVWVLTSRAEPAPRPVTLDEAARLAMARYTTFQNSPVRVRVEAPMAGNTVVVEGVVDYRQHHAVGSYEFAGSSVGLVAWDDRGLAVAPGRQADPLVAAGSMRPTDWSPRSYTTDPLDAGLRLSMLMGQDRPDNAQVLAEQGPRWLRAEVIDGKSYGVFAGPRPSSANDSGQSPLTYWIDETGGLRRVTRQLADLDGALVIDFPGGRAGQVPANPWQSR
ncbi:hypothetical protein [Amycolatopsis azurea]|uniref:LppX_LprAFG lipoprotein n=1 Tax=Amycolatopsis azurea DSM 43854 TaxID=1238180 RepID=M2QAD8_9PSEU|nr:hypothetical protein [Amycolatopsis azurea]EMD23691.1 hypothetical protein C791_6777 [Amycolatopsis azurea DSM 43854]OOC02979.1 hypothetical protein B0293_28810 [Amycolatopsis azurea DSM 43854]